MADKYVSPAGSDGATGAIGAPYLTWQKGLENVANGETVWLRGNAGNFVAQTISSAGSSGINGTPKYVRPYPGDGQVVMACGASAHFVWDNACDYVHIIGHADVRLGTTAGTIRISSTQNLQHVIEMYGTGKRLEGVDVDRGGTASASCVALGWNADGASDTYLADSCVITNCLLRNIGTVSPIGHDHGVYINYATNCEISYNVIKDIGNGWGIHYYTEATPAKHNNLNVAKYNTVDNTSHGGIIVGSDGASTTNNEDSNHNLYANVGQLNYPGTGVYSYMTFWGGPTGSGNTGTVSHSYNPHDGDVMPGITGFAISGTTNGNPLFVDSANLNYHLTAGSPALGTGAFPTIDSSATYIIVRQSGFSGR